MARPRSPREPRAAFAHALAGWLWSFGHDSTLSSRLIDSCARLDCRSAKNKSDTHGCRSFALSRSAAARRGRSQQPEPFGRGGGWRGRAAWGRGARRGPWATAGGVAPLLEQLTDGGDVDELAGVELGEGSLELDGPYSPSKVSSWEVRPPRLRPRSAARRPQADRAPWSAARSGACSASS